MFTALICKHMKLGLLYIKTIVVYSCEFSRRLKKNSLYYKSEQIRVNIAPETLNFPRIQDGEAVLLLNVFVVSPDSTGAKNVSFELSS